MFAALAPIDHRAITLANQVSRYFETTQVSKELAATEEAKGAAKKTTVAHDAVLGFPLDPEGFCLLAENNTPGGSALFKPFLKHLLVLSKKRDPQERSNP